jgi:hypothetical protein
MNRDDITDRLPSLVAGLLAVAGLCYFFPLLSWKLPLLAAVAVGFVWAYLMSVPASPREMPARLRSMNVTTGSFAVHGGVLLVGDQWGPERNRERLTLRGCTTVEFSVTARHGAVTGLSLRPADGSFEPRSLEVLVDTGFVSFFDSGWRERGLVERTISVDVKEVLSTMEPLHLAIPDVDGAVAGLIVGSGRGDGVFRLRVTDHEARMSFR